MGRGSWRVLAGSGLLIASGLLAVAGAVQRWWPECRPGRYDTGPCIELQDGAHDFMVPTTPWIPVQGSAELYGASLLLLAAACVVVPGLLAGRPAGARLTAASVVVALGIAVLGVVTWLSGTRGEIVTVPALEVASLMWVLGLPALIVTALVSDQVEHGVGMPPRSGSRTFVVVALLLANPIAQLVLAPAFLGYTSHDMTPWTEAVGGWALVVAGAVLLVAGRPATAPATVPIRTRTQPMV